MLKSNVVYKITCSQCQLRYVGQTARHLATRYKEHVSPRGLLRKHFDNCQITPSFDLVDILGRAKGEKLLTLEALFIAEIKPNLTPKMNTAVGRSSNYRFICLLSLDAYVKVDCFLLISLQYFAYLV